MSMIDYFKELTPDTVGLLGGFIGTGFVGGLIAKKFPKLTGVKGYFVRSLAKVVIGVGLYELANRFTRVDTFGNTMVLGASAGTLLSIGVDGIETFTRVRLQSGDPNTVRIGAGDFEMRKKEVAITSDGRTVSGLV